MIGPDAARAPNGKAGRVVRTRGQRPINSPDPSRESKRWTSELRQGTPVPAEPTGASSSAQTPADAAKRLEQSLGLGPGVHVDQASACELAAMLVEFAASLDQVVWSTWKIVSPSSPLKRATPARVAMAKFASGDPGITREQVRQDLERLRQLTAALTASVNQAGRVYAQKHVDRFAPAEIEKLARVSGGGGGVLVGQEVKCWRKYVELSVPLDAQAIERELMGAMSGYAESLLKGLSK